MFQRHNPQPPARPVAASGLQPQPTPTPQLQQPPRRRSTFSEQMARRSSEIQRARQAETTSPAEVRETRSPPRLLALGDDPRVFCHRDLIQRCGPNAGLLLSQLVYWFQPAEGDGRPRARALRDDGRWLKTSGAALATETGLPPWTAQRSLKQLREQGLIEQDRTHIRLTEAVRSDAILDGGVLVYAATVKMTGDAAAAIVLSQLCYWSDADAQGRCRLRVHRHGQYWIAKTYEALAVETGLPARGVRLAMDRLTRLGIVIKDHFMFGGVRTLHLRLDPEVFADAWVNAVTG